MEKLKLEGSGALDFGPARLQWTQGGPLRISLGYRGAYGLGERFDSLNQKGRRVVCEVYEKFCFQGGSSYCPAPFSGRTPASGCMQTAVRRRPSISGRARSSANCPRAAG